MVKFAQQLRAELVPEWQDAYCSYDDLKADLRRIQQQYRTMGAAHLYSRTGSLGLLKSLASFKPGLSTTALSRRASRRDGHFAVQSPRGAPNDTTIQITKRETDTGDDVFITELREPLSRSPSERTFFARLDAQLTKVNKFYKKKEGEYIARAGVLEKQMLVLMNLREDMAREGFMTADHDFFTKPHDRLPDVKETAADMPLIPEDELKSNDYPLQTFPMKPSPGHRQGDDGKELDIQGYIDQVAATNSLNQRRLTSKFAEAPSDLESSESHSGPGLGGARQLGQGLSRFNQVRFSPGTLDHYSAALGTPRSALKKVSHIPEVPEEEVEEQPEIKPASTVAVTVPVDNNVDIENQKLVPTLKTEKEFDQAKNLLRPGFVEFYRGLGLLSSYRSVNITAFAKILNGYDKKTGWHFAPIYMKEVESSYFVTSSKVQKLMTKVEDIYTKHFAEGVRKKAINQLRPTRKQGSHRTTFFIGLFAGCSIALFISFFFLVENKNKLSPGGSSTTRYLETVFPEFSTLMLLILHIFCYAWNVFAWAKTRVNYPFVFGFSVGTEMRYREVLLLATGLTMCLLGAMNIHIAVSLLLVQALPSPPPGSGVASMPPASIAVLPLKPLVVDVIPLILIVVTLATLFLPFNLMYRSARMFFLGCLRRLISAPFVKVILPDFFLGDQLTSQVLVFRNLEFMACYYPTGYFLHGADTKCDLNPVFRGFGYIVALLPFWWRFLQCLRRYYDEKDTHQLENAGKYFSAIVALALRQGFSNNPTITSLWVLSIIASVVATIFASYWDLCVDWGLLNRNSRNKWLRDKIILKRKSLYFSAIGTNCFLRLVWMLSILQVDQKFGWNANAFNVSTASLEILRRGIWNFFRIENEHLNNVGKYRAVKAVPLPFNDD